MVKRTLVGLAICSALIFSCTNDNSKTTEKSNNSEYQEINSSEYELLKPEAEAKAVLILFGGYTQTAKDIKREFKVYKPAKNRGIVVLYLNYNQKLWLEGGEKEQLASMLSRVFQDHQLPNNKIYLGGFSSGGNLALLMGDYLTENKAYQLAPAGVFAVDSPLDLTELYLGSEKNVERNFSEVSVQESKWLIQTLGNQFGNPTKDISKYRQHSVFTLKKGYIANIQNLKEVKIRLYTEPDTLWWKENRKADYQQTNAYPIKKLSEKLKNSGFKRTEYIPTENRGYRANGDRHPHSWSIVDSQDLINWMLNE